MSPKDTFPKLFSYEKLFTVRFAKYFVTKFEKVCLGLIAQKVRKYYGAQICTKSTDIRLFKCDCMSKKNFENIVSI